MRRLLVVMVLLGSTMGTQAWSCPYPPLDDGEHQMAMRRAPGDDLALRGESLPPPVPAGWLVLAGMIGLTGMVVRHFRRVNALRDAVAEPISLLVAERLARASQRRGGVIAAIGIVGVPALVVMDMGMLPIISTIIGAIGVRRFGIARSVLQLIETPSYRVAAERIGHIVVVRSSITEVQLEVAPGELASELRRAIPTARASQR
jgi:hypothetical protein